MFTISRAINLLLKQTNTLSNRFLIEIFPGFQSLDPSFLNITKTLRLLTGLKRTIEIISIIEKAIIIMALAELDLQVSPWPPELIKLIFWHKTVVTGYLKRITKIWAKLSVTIVTRNVFLLINTLSLTSQKTSISLGNLYVSDWH